MKHRVRNAGGVVIDRIGRRTEQEHITQKKVEVTSRGETLEDFSSRSWKELNY